MQPCWSLVNLTCHACTQLVAGSMAGDPNAQTPGGSIASDCHRSREPGPARRPLHRQEHVRRAHRLTWYRSASVASCRSGNRLLYCSGSARASAALGLTLARSFFHSWTTCAAALHVSLQRCDAQKPGSVRSRQPLKHSRQVGEALGTAESVMWGRRRCRGPGTADA